MVADPRCRANGGLVRDLFEYFGAPGSGTRPGRTWPHRPRRVRGTGCSKHDDEPLYRAPGEMSADAFGRDGCRNQFWARSGRDIQETIGIAGSTQPSPATT